MLRNRDELDSLLKQAFEEGVSWPIERLSLNALSDMGLTIEQIARYFSVDPVEVRAFLKPVGSHGDEAQLTATTTVGERSVCGRGGASRLWRSEYR